MGVAIGRTALISSKRMVKADSACQQYHQHHQRRQHLGRRRKKKVRQPHLGENSIWHGRNDGGHRRSKAFSREKEEKPSKWR